MIRSWLKRHDVKEIEDSNVESIEDIKERLDHFRNLSRNGIENLTQIEWKQLIEDINYYYSGWGYWINRLDKRELFRVTVNKRITKVNENNLTKISQLTGPPLEFLKNLGRCNGLDRSVFYAADSLKAAIFEAVPEIGDYITISKWRLKECEGLVYCHIFHPDVTPATSTNKILFDEYHKTFSEESPLRAAANKENIKFLTEELIKSCENQNSVNYIFSLMFSEAVFSLNPDSQGRHVQAVTYPSTKLRNGQMNYAFPDEIVHQKFDLIEIGFSQILNLWQTPNDPIKKIDMDIADIRITNKFNLGKDSIW